MFDRDLRWRAARLLESPHRLCFFFAGLNWAVAALWWAVMQLGATAGIAWPWYVAPGAAHGLWFGFGAMPLFIAGFMTTAGPKWLRRPPVDARELRLAVSLFVYGWSLTAAGFHLDPLLAAFGIALVTLGWGMLSVRIIRLVVASTQPDRLHPKAIAIACVVIAIALAIAALAIAARQPQWLRAAVRFGLWAGIVGVFVVVSHRLLPFLGEGAWPALDRRWPDWPLWTMLSVPIVRGWAALLEPWWVSNMMAASATLPGSASLPVSIAGALQSAHLAIVATLGVVIALRWRREPALKQPLIAMLFAALVWWDLALWLEAAACWPQAAFGFTADIAARLDLAAMHVLTIGFLGGTMLVMVTRISSTRSGRARSIDGVARALFVVLQVAVLGRLVAIFMPTGAALALSLSALAWLIVAVTWAVRHGRWLGLPRVDGRPEA